MILHTGHPPGVSDSPWAWMEAYHVTLLAHRPWVVLRDGAGFSDPLTMDYLTFYAGQDRAPKPVRSEGRWLAIAATWLAGDRHHDWTHADWDSGRPLSKMSRCMPACLVRRRLGRRGRPSQPCIGPMPIGIGNTRSAFRSNLSQSPGRSPGVD